MKMFFDFLNTPELVCYDGDAGGDSGGGDGGGAGGGDGGGSGSGQGDGGGGQGSGQGDSNRTFTQEEVNKFLAEDRRKHAQKMEALQNQLQHAKLTEEERESLENHLQEVQKQLLTKEQQQANEKKRLEQEYQAKLKELEEKAQTFEQRYTQSSIQRSLLDAAASNDAFNPDQIVTLLAGNTKLNEEDKVVVDFHDRHVETGEPIVTQLSPSDAVKRMKELPETYGNLFKSNVATGLGANSASGDVGKVNKASLTPEQYKKLRKENPQALGL